METKANGPARETRLNDASTDDEFVRVVRALEQHDGTQLTAEEFMGFTDMLAQLAEKYGLTVDETNTVYEMIRSVDTEGHKE